jgi:cation diffusion facilitator CzcD-associated flavoprotein CzcO
MRHAVPWRNYQFPDFLWPKELRPVKDDYPSGLQVKNYIQAYAAHFDLLRHIRFNCKLLRLRWCRGTSQWEALFCDTTKEKFFKVGTRPIKLPG